MKNGTQSAYTTTTTNKFNRINKIINQRINEWIIHVRSVAVKGKVKQSNNVYNECTIVFM